MSKIRNSKRSNTVIEKEWSGTFTCHKSGILDDELL